jgi:ABC-type uncharacterized transport system ATPase subunit
VAAAIEVVGLTKVYGELRAVDGVDLMIDEGTSSASSARTVPARRRCWR